MIAGAGVAVAALGPALGPGALFNLDLVLTPRLPVPAGVWGLGPALPRRVPLGVPLAWASHLIGGAAAGKLLLALAIAAAFMGASRLAAGASVAVRAGAGLLYALSPFTLTRVGVGHLSLVAALALLPWAVPVLLRPAEQPRRVLLWSAALGATGFAGGVLGLIAVALGWLADRGRRPVAILGAALIGNLPWIVPGVVVWGAGPQPASSGSFPTDSDGLLGAFRIVAGHGFWRASSQVGGDGGLLVGLIGVALLATAVIGGRSLPGWGARGAVTGLVVLCVALASAAPGLSSLYDDVAGSAFGAPLREGQRAVALLLVWLAPAAALGMGRIAARMPRVWASRLVELAPVGLALALGAPGLWGIGGRLEPSDIPPGWAEARRTIAAAPGPVLALPWHQYVDLSFAGGRRVLNPLPDYLGGDVIISSDPELAGAATERADAREQQAQRIADAVEAGGPAGPALARLGVRWLIVAREADWSRWQGVVSDATLVPAVQSPTIDLYAVPGWRGEVVADDGQPVDLRPVVAPLGWLQASGPATWHRPWSRGWLRGTHAITESEQGTLHVPAGRGPVWHWPTILVIFADVVTIVTVMWVAAIRPFRVRRRSGPLSDLSNNA